MELRTLKYFLAVAKEENITHAADLLHVTQPTLSRQMAALEEELGAKLFIRTSHRIVLTDDGLLLKSRAQEMIDLAERTKRDFLLDRRTIAGEVAFGCGELLSMSCLSVLMAKFRRQNPQVRYSLFSGNADDIKDRLEKGLLDIGLLLEPVDVARNEFIRLPCQEEWGVLARDDSPLAAQETVSPDDLASVPLLVTSRTAVQNELRAWFGSRYSRLETVTTFNLLYNAAVMVRSGLGAAIAVRLAAQYEGLRFVPLSPRLTAQSVLAWKNDRQFSPAVRAFIDFTDQCIKSISCDKN